MILFIFEGKKDEPCLYDNIKSLFFSQDDGQVLCSFCSNIYTFYKRLKDDFDGFADVVSVLKAELKKTDPDSELFKYKSADFESIYLFFDYDFYRGLQRVVFRARLICVSPAHVHILPDVSLPFLRLAFAQQNSFGQTLSRVFENRHFAL